MPLIGSVAWGDTKYQKVKYSPWKSRKSLISVAVENGQDYEKLFQSEMQCLKANLWQMGLILKIIKCQSKHLLNNPFSKIYYVHQWVMLGMRLEINCWMFPTLREKLFIDQNISKGKNISNINFEAIQTMNNNYDVHFLKKRRTMKFQFTESLPCTKYWFYHMLGIWKWVQHKSFLFM